MVHTLYFNHSHSASGHTDSEEHIKAWAGSISHQPSNTVTAGSLGTTISQSTAINQAATSRTTAENDAATDKAESTVDASNDGMVGGLEDEDEADEREVALSSPVKAGKRLTSKV
jgi:hypothetical protein